MARDQESGDIEVRRFRWEQVVAVVGALAAVGNWAWTNRQARLQDERAQKIEDRVEANARATKQIEMLPEILGLLREGKCDSDLAAVTLLREASNFQAAGETFGLAAARASLTMVKARQQAAQSTSPPTTYCGCDSLRLVTTLTESGRDADLARIAAEISGLARETGGPCAVLLARDRARDPEGHAPVARARFNDELDSAAKSLTDAQYTVVLGNDQDCELARTAYRRNADALTRGLGGSFDQTQLRLQAGTGRWRNYLVTTYGNFTLEQAGDLVTRLQGMGGVRSDVYWARSKTYTAQSGCPPK